MLDIVTIRRQIKQVPSLLRQGKTMLAIKAVVEGLRLVLSTPLMKSEKDEFTAVFRDAVSYIANDKTLRQLYPLAIRYTPGTERETLEQMVELLEIVNEDTMTDVNEAIRVMEEKKRTAVEQGQRHLDAQEFDEARKVFSDIAAEFSDDGDLKSEIGEKALAAGLYEDAVLYFKDAVSQNPKYLSNYNRLAISLRKLGRFELAVEVYSLALRIAPDDPFLLFNLGRLHAEWGNWAKAAEFGEKALEKRPGFVEAEKLVSFAHKKI